jgi:transposase
MRYLGVPLREKSGKFVRYGMDIEGLKKFKLHCQRIEKAGNKLQMAVESTGNTKYFKKEMEKEGFKVKVVNTLKFKVVNESVNKTDKRDAKTIAEFLSKDMIPEVKLSSDASDKLKKLITARKLLVETNVKLKNQLHGILLGLGIKTRVGQMNSKKGRVKIVMSLEDKTYRRISELLTGNIDEIANQVKNINAELEKLTENDRAVQILRSIPGAGLITAVTVRAYIDDIRRFSHYNRLSSYCGLVPKVKCSDTNEWYGRITKRGPVELRTAIIQMVLGMIRFKVERNNRLMNIYAKMKKIKGSGKSLVAVARKFTRIIWVMLTRNEEFDRNKLSLEY